MTTSSANTSRFKRKDATPDVSGLRAASEVQQAHWEAHLELGFRADARRTTLARRRHHGPLTVQQPFYPEADGTCHVYLLHPPGGVAGGDALSIDAHVGARARALLTTPAATKLYRTQGTPSSQQQTFCVEAGASLEWLPQETIVFDGAHATFSTRIELAHGADFIGWEVVCLGRPACGEAFARGHLRQVFEVHREGTPLFIERARYVGGAAVLDAPWGLGGQPTVGTLVCVTAGADALVERLRDALGAGRNDFAVSQLRDVVVCRYLGAHTEPALAGFRRVWTMLRETLFGRAACTPRIWLT